jgi:hypothetical protein
MYGAALETSKNELSEFDTEDGGSAHAETNRFPRVWPASW